MVASSTMIALVLAVIFLLVLGLGPIVYLKMSGYRIGLAALFGALGFFISQVILRTPILNLLMTNMTVLSFFAQNIVAYALFLGVSAAAFETIGRLFVVNVLLRKRKGWLEGAVSGWGHGFCEAFILLGLTYIQYIYLAFLVNQGTLATMGLDSATVASVTSLLSSFPVWAVFVALLERVCAMLLHCALSTLIMTKSMDGKSWVGALIAFLVHAFLDTAIVLIQAFTGSVFMLELLPVIFAIVSVVYLVRSYAKYKNA